MLEAQGVVFIRSSKRSTGSEILKQVYQNLITSMNLLANLLAASRFHAFAFYVSQCVAVKIAFEFRLVVANDASEGFVGSVLCLFFTMLNFQVLLQTSTG